MTLTPFSPVSSPIRAWLSSDALGQRFLPSYLSDSWEPLIDFKTRHLWLAEEGGEAVGFFDLELGPSGAGYFVFYVAPAHRGKGFAKKIAEAGLSTDAAKTRRFFEVGVEPENAASIRVLESLGFEKAGEDEDGMLLFRRGGLPLPPQPPLSRFFDLLMLPVMYLVAGTFERPQRTHRWNVRLLSETERASIDRARTLRVPGDPKAGPRWWGKLPIFHIPILGGWREYVALEPEHGGEDWRLGWMAGDATGISMIPLSGPARALRGPGESEFFGVSRDGEQLSLHEVGRGRIGDGGPFRNLELL